MSNFALIGAGGYIAPRHLEAIKVTGNELIVALDRHDSVGVLDKYYPNAFFFTEFERFDRHIEKLRRGPAEGRVHYVSICSPNYLHDAHIRFALRIHADAICEKPLVLEPWNVDALAGIAREYGQIINTILQLRLHPSLIALRSQVLKEPRKMYDVDLTYITSRGRWYRVSWKGDDQKSGGITMNIGIHFFDILQWIFGEVRQNTVHHMESSCAAGYLELELARVRWFLSLDASDLPLDVAEKGNGTYRTVAVDGHPIEFSSNFTELHIKSYQEILAGRGFGLEDVKPSIQIVHDIRNMQPVGIKGEYHPFLRKHVSK